MLASRLKLLVAAYTDVVGSVAEVTREVTLKTLSLKPLLYEVGNIVCGLSCTCPVRISKHA